MDGDLELSTSIETGNISVGIIGLGYVGLPTAIGFLDAGFNVWGVDVSKRVVDTILQGENPTGDPEINDIIPDPKTAKWNITTDTSIAVENCEILIVTVPTPVTSDLKPDLKYVIGAGDNIFKAIKPNSGKIVVLESTVYPGVTAQSWLPLIEKYGLTEGVDVNIAYCPERFNPGDEANGVRKVARVIGSLNPKIGNLLVKIYSKLTSGRVDYVGKIEVAEAAKVIENVQRDINIALVNELARIFPALNIDIEDVLNAAATKWNFHRYTPGVGVGGHCIPVDPYYMIQRAEQVGVPAELITAARAVNRTMPTHVFSVLKDILYKNDVPANNSNVLFLGWSYKAEVGDHRETPAEHLALALTESGIKVSVWDPHLENDVYPNNINVINDINSVKDFDLVVLVTGHSVCINIDWELLLEKMRKPLIYDGRRVLDLNKLEELGWDVYAVGKP
ncbi:MAG: nucleotide sugar dehydrogenase [Euryarchaeota archaeon]|nr:nucleotide sugar dehydrogenase [Euryarchaeota archaeon]|tara:strand:- start:8108 stop:9454 length:1347 start_codon:yes stop_codon:yes gene_type:complete